jgi:hypothetical protein
MHQKKRALKSTYKSVRNLLFVIFSVYSILLFCTFYGKFLVHLQTQPCPLWEIIASPSSSANLADGRKASENALRCSCVKRSGFAFVNVYEASAVRKRGERFRAVRNVMFVFALLIILRIFPMGRIASVRF